MADNGIRFSRVAATFALMALVGGAQTAGPVFDPIMRSLLDSHQLAGAVVMVASKDSVLNLEASGYADLAAKTPMKTDSLFWIASMSKPITATAFMMLVDEGKVNVDDPVEKYLPEYKNQWLAVEEDKEHLLLRRPKQKILVRHILSHTSGLPATSLIEQPTLDLLRLRDAVLSYTLTPLKTEPGTKYSYSNAGINTAGRIIEVVSGMPYEEFLQKRLFDPLGMTDTTFWPSEAQLKRLAKSYKLKKDGSALEEETVTQLRYPLNDRSRQPMPAGGLFSTTADTLRFCQMILSGGVYKGRRYLSEAALKQMTSLQTGDLPEGYGFGWSVLKKAAGDGRSAGTFGHGGAYKTAMWIDPALGRIFILMRHEAGTDNTKLEPDFLKLAVQRFGGR